MPNNLMYMKKKEFGWKENYGIKNIGNKTINWI